MPDHNKETDRVNISEELSKTAAWKQLTYAEHANTTPSSNVPNESTDGKKRRKKRSRGQMQRSICLPANGGFTKPRFAEENELVEMKPNVEQSVESNPFYEDQKANAAGLNFNDTDRTSPEIPSKETERSPHSKPPSRKNSEDRRKKDRGDLVKRNSSKERNSSKDRNTPKRHDSKDRNQMKRQSSHDRKHKLSNINKPKPPPPDETPLPPWEQPYHSPPRKDLGLLHAQDTAPPDLNFDPVYSMEDNEQEIPSISLQLPSEDEETRTRRSDQARVPIEDSGDASCELDGL